MGFSILYWETYNPLSKIQLLHQHTSGFVWFETDYGERHYIGKTFENFISSRHFYPFLSIRNELLNFDDTFTY